MMASSLRLKKDQAGSRGQRGHYGNTAAAGRRSMTSTAPLHGFEVAAGKVLSVDGVSLMTSRVLTVR